ncbi:MULTISPECIES: phosphatidylinositol phosphate synthase [Nocardiopsis]|uniref:phosphatidylinositol phosphate synthase n=1 Tax=Nocardiopsis TaxID=2013 RepID=UPI0003452B78|nr:MULTISPECIES: CDP-alcohol phosphatidyltransferase family protein [Nocardiopsis]
MLRFLRPAVGRVTLPIGRALARLGVTANMVTLTGTFGAVAAALGLLPLGELYIGAVVVTVFVLFDMLDGAVARASGRESRWGAFLDSTLDRLTDAAVLCGLAVWFYTGGADPLLGGLAMYGMATGFAVSYIKARAEGLGVNCDVGVAERSERLVIALTATGLAGLGVPHALDAGLWLLALLNTVTVAQRLIETRARLTEPGGGAGAGDRQPAGGAGGQG